MKVLLIHKTDGDRDREFAWYGWFSFEEWFDDNCAEFSGATREEALANARFHAAKFRWPQGQSPDWEAEVLDLESE